MTYWCLLAFYHSNHVYSVQFTQLESIAPFTVHYKLLAVLQGIKYLTEQ